MELYTIMQRIRGLDVAIRRGLAAGQFSSPYYAVGGLEATCAAIGVALTPQDYLVSTYRCLGDVVAKGVPLREIVSEMYGRVTGTSKGKGGAMHMADTRSGLMATTGIVGGGMPIANGLALAAKLRGEPRVAVATFGDGATSIGAFHESLNLAAVWELPVVFVCQNNQWGEHTPLDAYTKNTELTSRATAVGMRAVRADGFDPLAIRAAIAQAVSSARAGAGPTMVESLTYRLGPHSFGGDESYMPQEERTAASARDPVPRFRSFLETDGGVDADALAKVDEAITSEIADAFAFAEASDPTPDDEMGRDVFAGDTGAVAR